ncbi:MAG: hypothetical protein ABJA80_01930 [bacterium]
MTAIVGAAAAVATPRLPAIPTTMRWRAGLALLGICAVVIGVVAMDRSPVGAAVDDAMYVILAKSLATGQGYRSLNLPGQPQNTHFPPGYPAVLSVLWRAAPAFPANLIVFRLFNILCIAVAAVATARFVASRGVRGGWAFGIGAVTAVSVPLLVLGGLLLSEPLFIAILLILLAALERFASPVSPEATRAPWHGALLGVSIGLAMLVRTHGIVLIPAMLIVLGAQRRWRDAAVVTACAAACLLPWQLFSREHANTLPAPLLGGYDSYTAWWVRGLHEWGWGMIPHTLGRTMPEAAGMFAALFSPGRSVPAHAVTGVALIVLVIAAVVAWWRRIPVTILFLAGYLAIVAVWPFQPGRFIWGVWPLILVLLALGGRAAFQSGLSWHRGVRAVVLASFCWAATGYALYEVRAIRGQWWSSIPRGAVDRIRFAVGWTRANTRSGDVVATEDEGPVYLYTGRSSVPVRSFTVDQYLATPSPEQDVKRGLVPLLAAYPVRAVIASTQLARDEARYLASLPNSLLVPQGQFAAGDAYLVRGR